MGYSAKILLDSKNAVTGDRITTWELSYPRFVHAELMTHRVFSRNSASSRAIPVKKMMERVRKDPVIPKFWGANQSGMQAAVELTGWRLKLAQTVWLWARWPALFLAWTLVKIGLHKQIANRILEPWMYITIILTATEFKNWFKLRCHKDAQPEIQWLAYKMHEEYCFSTPRILNGGEWHIPMLDADEAARLSLEDKLKVSTGRVARVSYLTHDGIRDFAEDIKLHNRLIGPGHWSPFEHCARASHIKGVCSSNFTGFIQYRKFFPGEDGIQPVGLQLPLLERPIDDEVVINCNGTPSKSGVPR